MQVGKITSQTAFAMFRSLKFTLKAMDDAEKIKATEECLQICALAISHLRGLPDGGGTGGGGRVS